MGKKTALFLAILTAVTLSACGENAVETAIETEQVTTVSEVTTTAETTVEVTTATDAETTAVETTSAVEEDKILPVVYSADEKYEHYPMEIIYPAKQETDITAETAETAEDLCNADGYCIVRFEANYPVFSSENVDSAVLDKINQQVKAYIDEIYQKKVTQAEEYTEPEETEFFEWDFYETCGFVWQRIITYDINFSDDVGYSEWKGFDVCGNILSVDFTDYSYGAGAAHGLETPVPMMFDLRTGERIMLSEMVGDKMSFSERFMSAISGMTFAVQLERESATMAEYYDFFMDVMTRDCGEEYGVDENGEIIIGYYKADKRLTVKNGCVGFYVAPYEYGSYADGIRLAEVPVDDLLPYMNDEGKALFEGVVSATAEPVMITVEDGKEKIISREQAEEMLSEREE